MSVLHRLVAHRTTMTKRVVSEEQVVSDMQAKRVRNGTIDADHAADILSDTIECGICMHRMLGPIFICREGHCVCDECYNKLTHPMFCWGCRKTVSSRNRSLEAIVARCDFACQHSCGLVAKPVVLLEYQPRCSNAPVKCPLRDCDEEMNPKDLMNHVKSSHVDEFG